MRIADLFDHLLIDLDGVVYVGDKLTTGAKETIAILRAMGKSVIFLTNDPRSSSGEYAEKLRSMGIQATSKEVITSGMAIALYIKEHYELSNGKAYVIGSQALKDEIKKSGLKLADDEESKKANFVIVGGHPGFNYEEMKLATIAIRAGALFFGTNSDPLFPTSQGLVPATGAIIASIEYASGKTATIAGKPEPIMFEAAKKLFSSQDKIAIIGDRLDTDIGGGKRANISTILALSGSTDRGELARSQIIPDYVIEDLRDLLTEK
jgi:phosphoglycolate/pyridoxal phosphate phosphatase family enzyme